jgi:hypothetical protein
MDAIIEILVNVAETVVETLFWSADRQWSAIKIGTLLAILALAGFLAYVLL